MYDLLIKNGMLVDGSGKDAYVADIAIQDEKIAAIGNLQEQVAVQVIDAKGRYVTPGFIDPHSHADMSLLVWPKNEAYTLQGVTTQICGNCGLAAGPIADDIWEFWCWEYASLNKTYKAIFEPYNFQTPKKGILEALKGDYGLEVTWKTLGEFMEVAEEKGFSCNYYPLSGHNHIRNTVMGKAARPATKEELDQMKAILRDDMEHGSCGFSTGLDYYPGRYATMEEIEELVKVAGEYGGVYSTHVRGFDPATPNEWNMRYGVNEATDICRHTGVKTNISHMSSLFAYSPKGSVDMEKAVAHMSVKELEKGWREEGLPMMYDVIANPSSGGSTIPFLIALLRPWVLMCGSPQAFMERIEYADFVDMIREQAAAGKYMMVGDERMAHMVCVRRCIDERFKEKRLSCIMQEHHLDTMVDAILMILKKDMYTTMDFLVEGGDDEVRILLDSERAMPCSDGFAFDLDTSLDYPRPLNRAPHPNNYCYAIRYLLYYGPKRLEDKIRRMTAVPAEWFNISDRGMLKVGNWADIVVLDLAHLKTNEDSVETGKAPDGIDYVIINGVIAAKHKQHTGALAGKVLRRK